MRFWRRTKVTRFLVDESLGRGTKDLLREVWGADAEFAPDVGLGGRDDREVFANAWRKRRVLLTHDKDFLDDRRFPEHRNPGVIILPGAAGNDEALLQALSHAMLLMERNPDAWVGTKTIVQADGEVRIRQRWVDTGAVQTTRYRFTKNGPPLIWED